MHSHLGQWQNATLVKLIRDERTLGCQIQNTKYKNKFFSSSLKFLTFYSHGPIKFSPLAIKDGMQGISPTPPRPPLLRVDKKANSFSKAAHGGGHERRRRRTTTRHSCSE
jgi:hypothetical protein